MNIIGGNGLYQLNCANHDIPMAIDLYNEFKGQYKELMISYEDTHWDYTIFNESNNFSGKLSLNFKGEDVGNYKRIVFIRNFYSNLASRLKSNENKSFKTFEGKKVVLFDVTENFIWRWKNNARACLNNKVNYLRFEDWLNEPEIRKRFLNEVTGLNEIYDNQGIIGTTSSFGDIKNVANRDKEMNIPEEIKDLIRKDNELHYLIGALGYEYKEI